MPEWNAAKQALFDSGNALGVTVAKQMNVMQEYYKQLTSVVLLSGRKVAEAVAASVVPADWVKDFKARTNGRAPSLEEMLKRMETYISSLADPVTLDELKALRELQYNGNKGVHRADLTEAEHKRKPVVVEAVLKVRKRR